MPAEADSMLISGVFALLLASVLSMHFRCHGPESSRLTHPVIQRIVVMFIMMYLAFRKHRDLNSPLLTMFYRDGIFYFVCLSGMLASSRFNRASFVDPSLHSVLAIGNITVNLRAPVSRNRNASQFPLISSYHKPL
jgi:hypothetical protein